MDAYALILLAVAVVFAAVNGANDGGTLVATGLKIPTVRTSSAILLLCACVGVVPWLLGTRVAATLAGRLVPFEGAGGRTTLALAVLAAVGVVTLLARKGLPTSLTLALVGGIAGAGWGAGLPVSWGTVGVVLALAAAAPLAGTVLALLLAGVARRVPAIVRAGAVWRHAHRAAFLLLSVAYGANDGQKMLAVFGVAAGLGGDDLADPAILAASAVLFGLGLLLGLRRFAMTLTGGVLSLRPAHAVGAEVAASVAVLGSAALGAPVSMTQSLSAALVGSGMAETYRKIRWHEAARVGVAWLVTLPAVFTAAAAATRTLEVVT